MVIYVNLKLCPSSITFVVIAVVAVLLLFLKHIRKPFYTIIQSVVLIRYLAAI